MSAKLRIYGSRLASSALCVTLILISISPSFAQPLAKPVFDAENAFKYLEKQCEFGPRPPESAAHKRTRDYLISELQKFSEEVIAQDFTAKTKSGKLNLTNIIAIFGSESDKTLLLAAHWDTRPIADHDPDASKRNTPILGANDGASGVAILLELSRIFSMKPPGVKVVVVLFDGEDYGKKINEMLLGSRYFARKMNKRWRPDYGILIDMVGDKDLNIYVEPHSAKAAPEIVKKVWELAEELQLEGIYKEFGPAIMDDHIPLIEEGIKCIDIIDFDYPYWHTLEDTPDKCSPQSLETVGKLLLELVYSE